MAATKKKATKKKATKKVEPADAAGADKPVKEPQVALPRPRALADQLIAACRAEGSGRAVNYIQRAKASMRK